MPDHPPILFYDLVAQKDIGAPYFSPATIRARLGFALKKVPIQTVEVTYKELIDTWKDKLGLVGEKATVPFIQKPDGSYLMDSWAIMEWLDEAYPDRPSIFLPGEPAPVDRASEAYKRAVKKEDEAWKKFAGILVPVYDDVFGLFAPVHVQTFDAPTQAYWTSEARMGEGRWAMVTSMNKDESLTRIQHALAELATFLTPDRKFFASPDTPGLQDFFLMSFHRLLASSSAENVALTFGQELGDWLERVNGYFAEELAEVLARDPK